MKTSARVLMLPLLALAAAGCSGESPSIACRTAAQCLDDWRQHYDAPAFEWLQANPEPSRQLAVKLLLSADYRDRDLGAWLVTLAGLDDDPAIHRVVAPSLALGPEAATIYKTPQALRPSLEETMRRVMQAPPRDDVYAGLAGNFGMQAVHAVEQRLRCRPACERLDPAQASTILSSAEMALSFRHNIDAPRRNAIHGRIQAPIITLAEDVKASDAARMEAASLLARRTWDPRDYRANDSLAALLRGQLTSGVPSTREQAVQPVLALIRPLHADDWSRIAEVMDKQALSLDTIPLHLTHNHPRDGSFGALLLQRMAGEDTREASIALQILSDLEATSSAKRGATRALLASPDPALAAQSARVLLRAGVPLVEIKRAIASHWFPATSQMFGGGIASRERYRTIRNATCRTKPQRLSTVIVEASSNNMLLRMAARRLQTDVSHAVEHDGTLVASIFHGEFGGYLAVLRNGQPPEFIGHEPFGPLLHLDGDRFLVTSGVAHMDSLAGDAYELRVGPASSTLTHRLGQLSEPLALERQRGRVLLSTYAFGVMDLTDLSAPRWLGCQRPPVAPIR